MVLSSFLLLELMNHYNYLEVFPSELIFPIFMHSFSALLIALIVYFIPFPKAYSGKFIAVTLIGFMIVNYQDRLNNIAGIYRSLIPVLPTTGNDMPIISILFLGTIVLSALFIGAYIVKLQRSKSILKTSNIIYGIFVVIGFIFFSQLLRAINVLPDIINESKVTPPALSGSAQLKDNKPDIYYIVLDRYASHDVLKQQFNYDNSKFKNFLNNQGFTVNEDAFSNYPLTTASISSTLNADYTNQVVQPYKDKEVQSRTLYHNLIRQSSVIKALKQGGYSYYHIGSTYGASDNASQADQDLVYANSLSIFEKVNKRLRSFENYQFYNSPFYSFSNVALSWWPLKHTELNNEQYVNKQLSELNNLAGQVSGNRFIFAHILVPHDPFTFNGDGSISISPGTDNYEKPIKEKYLGQIQYISNQIQTIVEQINQKSDKKAVILLNADEGPYPWDMNKSLGLGSTEQTDINLQDMTKYPDDWLKMKFGILQAVQIPEMSKNDEQNLSSVNLFRIVLNNYLGYQLDYLPYCAYAFNKGDKFEYKYQDITGKLVENYDSQFCSQHQSL
jgi:hypothetical protein